MTMTSIGDLALAHMLRGQGSALKSRLHSLSQEMASGRVSDITQHLRGDFSHLATLERGMAVLDSYSMNAREAASLTATMQQSLDRIQDVAGSLGGDLVSAGSSNIENVIESAGQSAKGAFLAIARTLNSATAGASLFAGSEFDQAALAPGDVIFAELKSVVAGETTLSGVQAALNTWFDTPGGGFETNAYQGGGSARSPLHLGEGLSLDIDLRANNQNFRDIMKAAAMGALAGEDDLGFSADLKKDLIAEAGVDLLSDMDGLTGMRADLGYVQSRIEERQVQLSTEIAGMQLTHQALLGADPYETVTELENAQSQLETLYTVTVRTSRLSLLGFMQ